MRSLTGITLATALMVSGVALSANQTFAADGMAHAHMGHVTDGWNDTPDGKGLLPTAIAEAMIAIQHAGFAVKKPTDLVWMQTHAHHVLHAIDASLEANGPGLGYGVMKAAGGASKHINFAAENDGASDNVKAHTVHVMASTDNTVVRAKQIVSLAKILIASSSTSEAHTLGHQILTLCNELIKGTDADGDGSISWKQGEGGLNIALTHMGFMAKGEELN